MEYHATPHMKKMDHRRISNTLKNTNGGGETQNRGAIL